ncbi:MAG: 3-deoxy-manno-octulosonate cytidylyltransferase [Bacteroidales bacterium]
MNFIAIIPARYGSTRFPGKPLADIKGKIMIQWVFEQASKSFETVYVATDDMRIAQKVEAFGGKYIMTSRRHKSGTDRCAEAIEKIRDIENKAFDVIVNVQGDEPFVQPEQFAQIKKPFRFKRTQIATLAKPIINQADIFNPNKPKLIINQKKEAIYFSRSTIPFIRGKHQQKWISQHQFYKHIGLYAYRYKVLKDIAALERTPLEIAESLEQLRWIENGYKIRVELTEYEALSIDTKKDIDRIEHIGLI